MTHGITIAFKTNFNHSAVVDQVLNNEAILENLKNSLESELNSIEAELSKFDKEESQKVTNPTLARDTLIRT